jgi:aspartyl-tRNA(Asn)/glutamyl-tRNA(Gln) amidotransferase subunit A
MNPSTSSTPLIALTPLTVRDLRHALDTKTMSAVELAQDHLARINTLNHLNAMIDVKPELTLAQAQAADLAIAQGQQQPLTGIPLIHKDVFVTTGWRSTAGSNYLADYTSPFNATIVDKLQTAGAVCLGKANMDEFAMGSSNENSAFGAVKNPWDTTAVAGGSSGGSAAAVAAGLAPIATGSDTGGSIRQPASFCGISGIKPTYGSCSRYGMIAYASSLDQAGAMAYDAYDLATMLNVMVGHDPRESTSIQRPTEDFTQSLTPPTTSTPLQGLRIGLPKEYFGAGLDAHVGQVIDTALQQLQQLGATLVDISLPHTELSIPVYYVIAGAEASSNLSRFDGVRYGHRAAEYHDLMDMYKKTRAEAFGDEVKRRIMVGAYVLSHGYYDAYYIKAQQLRRLIAQDFQTVLSGTDAVCDIIAAPVSPFPAFNLGDKQDDPIQMYLADIYTLAGSLAGLPAMSIPAGFSAATAIQQARPIGLQLIGNYCQEARLLHTAHQYQQATDWHQRRPALSTTTVSTTTGA